VARGACTLARERLLHSDAECTWLGEAWARPVRLSEDYLGGLGADKFDRYEVRAMVFDELGKLNINAATRGQMGLFTFVTDEISGAVVDWRDADDAPVEYGAEQREYDELDPALNCKNESFESIYEALMLPGVTERAFYGLAAGPRDRSEQAGDGPVASGMRDFFTVYGSGRVNLNTASPEVLLALPGLDPESVNALLRSRRGADGLDRTPDDVPFESYEQLEELEGMGEFVLGQLGIYGVFSSDTFNIRVEVTDRRSPARLELDVIAKRASQGVDLLVWRER